MGERYRIEEQLGTGRAGAVFKAYDTELNRPVALRRFDTEEENYQDEGWLQRFNDVVSDLSQISHANILSVLDAGVDEEGPYLVTAQVEGLRISQILKQEGEMSLAGLYELTTQCLDALHAAENAGYYHHALCPSSVVGQPQGFRWLPLYFDGFRPFEVDSFDCPGRAARLAKDVGSCIDGARNF